MAREEIEMAEARIPEKEKEIKFLLVPADPEDGKNCILEIRAGTGGDEASIFAGDIFKMYSKFCEKKGWRLEVTNISEGTSGGFKEIVATITGENVYGIMKYFSELTFVVLNVTILGFLQEMKRVLMNYGFLEVNCQMDI